MSERWAVVLALSTALGAAMPHGLPVRLGAAMAVAALVQRRPALLCLGAALLASSLCERSWAGLHRPEPGRRVESRATLVTDPVQIDGAVKVELRLLEGTYRGKRVEAWARQRAAGELRPRLAGERVTVVGRLSPVTGRRQAYLARRHIAARLNLSEVGKWSPGGRLARLANDLRRTLLRGASSLSDEHRALFTGLVLGDDRDQGPGTVDDFRAAGLTHLLAVSGQNVAFVMALAAPLLRWLGLRGRLLAGLCLLVGFGMLTRWEPSVLRAEAMAAVAMAAATMGRPASTLRVLALATTALLLVDPLLVGSVGFLLSCGACAGIALFSGPLATRRVPLPVAVTLAAQIGVTPVLLPVFGGLPVASLPANLLAVPAAGPVMVWGLAGGLPAGFVGGPLATLVHLPTRLLVGWIAGVARWAADLPLGQLGAPHVLVLVVLAALYAFTTRSRQKPVSAVPPPGTEKCQRGGRRGDGGGSSSGGVTTTAAPDYGGNRQPPLAVTVPCAPSTTSKRLRTAIVTAAVAVVLWPAGPGAGPAAANGRPVGGGARLWTEAGGATVLVVAKARPGALLRDLRSSRVRGLSVVVLSGASRREEVAIEPVLERHPARHILTSATAAPGDALLVGRLRLVVLAVEPRLEVRVTRLTGRARQDERTPGPRLERVADSPVANPPADRQ
ncbi:MAG TPA: ComEC/Rec2 family competence protein [Acidimicrobiales bacterium]|nr:ComEC/Rec2 family competence protein [Acidimicrobiales bacterium]